MKAKVVIENGKTTIVLTPENDFEKDVIEKVYTKEHLHTVDAQIKAQYDYGGYHKHRIELLLIDKSA